MRKGRRYLRQTIRWSEAHPVLAIAAVAFAVRAILAVVVYRHFGGYLFGDDLRYSVLAEGKAEGARAFAALSPDWGPPAYTRTLYDQTATLLVPVTALYKIFGPLKLLGQIWVGLMGAGAAAATAALALHLVGRRGALIAGALVALLPSQVVFSSLILKDAGVWVTMALLAVLVYGALRATGRQLILYGAAITGILFLVGHLRTHTMIIACWALALSALIGARQQWVPRVLAALAVAVALPWAFGLGPAGSNNLHSDALNDLGFRRAANSLYAKTAVNKPRPAPAPSTGPSKPAPKPKPKPKPKSGSATPAPAEPTTTTPSEPELSGADRLRQLYGQSEGLVANLKQLPRGVSVTLLEPAPWTPSDSLSVDLARYETVIWYPTLLFGLIGLVSIRRRHLRLLAFPVLSGAGILLVYALTEGNVGTAFRHRGELVSSIVLLAVLGGQVALGVLRQRRSPGEPRLAGAPPATKVSS